MRLDEQRLLEEELGISPLWRARHQATLTALPPCQDVVASPPASAQAPLLFQEKASIEAAWTRLSADVPACQRCILHKHRLQAVLGEGNRDADWLFIGEGPGREEDQQGRPFVGRAGRLLDAMLLAAGLSRTEVYIANAVKCRPPNNRTPFWEEMKACFSFLTEQIALVNPRVIVLLGKSAALSVLGLASDMKLSLGSLRQRVHRYNHMPVIVTYHPAYLLRQPTEKSKAWEDLLFAQSVYAGRHVD